MKKKSSNVLSFIKNLHKFIIENPQFRKDTQGKNETQIQTELRPILLQYLEKYFTKANYRDVVAKANKSFYWEGQEGQYGKDKATTFGTRNYPDFIITDPYLIAVEYKQSSSGSAIKHGIGQSIMHTLCEEFHYVYFLFHDENKDKRIADSICNKREKFIIAKMWNDFNTYINFI